MLGYEVAHRPRRKKATGADWGVMTFFRGVLIGQAVTDPDDGWHVVAIDPDLDTLEIEDSGGSASSTPSSALRPATRPLAASTDPLDDFLS
jgi:hypothetical protein